MSLSNRTFGIELEFILPVGTSHSVMASKVRAALSVAGFDNGCYSEDYNHSTRPSWKITTDGSVTSSGSGHSDYVRGAEIVSPILSGEDGLKQADVVARTLLANGATVNKTCGFHVHVFAGDFTLNQMRNTFLNYVWFEDFFDHIMPPSRRRNSGYYVQSNRARSTYDYGTAGLNAWFGKLSDESLAVVRSSYDNDMVVLIRAFSGGERYLKLNPQAYLRQKTLEFRQHSGTVDPDKVTRWVRLLVGFVEKSMVSKPRPRTVTRDLTPAEEMNRFFAYVGGFIDGETRAYYVKRRADLAGEAKRIEQNRTATMANGEAIARQLIDALNVRRETALARRHNRIAQRCSDAANSLAYALALPATSATRSASIANYIRNVESMNLVPAIPRTAARTANPSRMSDAELLAELAA